MGDVVMTDANLADTSGTEVPKRTKISGCVRFNAVLIP